MAELLLLADDRPGLMIGDIIHVAENGTEWGDQECVDTFVVVRVDMTVDEARKLLVPVFVDGVNAKFEKTEELVHEHRYYVDMNEAFTYDDLAYLYTVNWVVPRIDTTHIKDKASA